MPTTYAKRKKKRKLKSWNKHRATIQGTSPNAWKNFSNRF